MTEVRKHYTAEQKVAILRRHLVEHMSVSDVCSEYGIAPSVFYRRQQQLFENGAAAFGPPAKGETAPLSRKISALEEKLTRKNEALSELMEEYVSLKRQRSWRKHLGMSRADLGRARHVRWGGGLCIPLVGTRKDLNDAVASLAGHPL